MKLTKDFLVDRVMKMTGKEIIVVGDGVGGSYGEFIAGGVMGRWRQLLLQIEDEKGKGINAGTLMAGLDHRCSDELWAHFLTVGGRWTLEK
ncbi:hypothetical protein QVD17_30119 [Tagetes erecta]|uniref:Uncharacterized protein n=1 Tax=Tagetes erecta TaxID=13708 RepID=A0AAD8NFR5_TARER|nr:hypothetical protein QVD17_30119 [Tagetes erecta]